MQKKPQWMCCSSDSGSLRVSPRLKSVFVRAVDILEAYDHMCAVCLFDAIIDLIGIGDLADMMHEQMGRA
jgi:hypothetical protein